jgi:hypothetical protein
MRKTFALLVVLGLAALGMGQTLHPTPPPHPDAVPDITHPVPGTDVHPGVYNASAADSTLLTGITAFWQMDETSGSREDAVGSLDWTDVATVGFTTGKVGNAAVAVKANSERLDLTYDFWSGGDFTFVSWFLHDVDETKMLIRCATINGGTARSMRVYFNNGNDRMQFAVYASPSDWTNVITDTNLSTPGPTDWHMAAAAYDSSTKKPQVSVDGGSWIIGGTALTNDPRAATFNNIALDSSSGYTNLTTDLVGIWDRVLTEAELIELYNGGDGNAYPF